MLSEYQIKNDKNSKKNTCYPICCRKCHCNLAEIIVFDYTVLID